MFYFMSRIPLFKVIWKMSVPGLMMYIFIMLSAVSEAPVEAPKAKKYESYSEVTYKSDEQKKEEVSHHFKY